MVARCGMMVARCGMMVEDICMMPGSVLGIWSQGVCPLNNYPSLGWIYMSLNYRDLLFSYFNTHSTTPAFVHCSLVAMNWIRYLESMMCLGLLHLLS